MKKVEEYLRQGETIDLKLVVSRILSNPTGLDMVEAFIRKDTGELVCGQEYFDKAYAFFTNPENRQLNREEGIKAVLSFGKVIVL